MYCTPKIHKTGNPLRPIEDYTGSIGYNISRALADLLAPLVGKTKYHVHNSKQLSDEMKVVKLKEDMFFSHDVVSLVTNTPIPQSTEIINNKLKKDKTLKKRTLLSPEDIVELLEFVNHNILHVSGTSIPTEIWYSHGQSSVTSCGKPLHGGPRTNGDGVSIRT